MTDVRYTAPSFFRVSGNELKKLKLSKKNESTMFLNLFELSNLFFYFVF